MRHRALHALALMPLAASMSMAQPPAPARLSLADARRIAIERSPTSKALTATTSAERSRARQSAAWPNPHLGWRLERTGDGLTATDQTIVEVAQLLDLAGAGRARRTAGIATAEGHRARATATLADIEMEVIEGYYRALASDGKLAVADRTIAAFDRALGISSARRSEGDISGLAHRRLELEAARFAAARVSLTRSARTQRYRLASSLGNPDSETRLELTDSLPWVTDTLESLSSLIAEGVRKRPTVLALLAEHRAATVWTTAEQRGRIPLPTVTVGIKSEKIGVDRQAGLVGGLSIPVPLLDRRVAAIDAAKSVGAAAAARLEQEERDTARDIAVARAAVETLVRERDTIRVRLGLDATTALAATELGFAEGELSVTEWLDTMRAYYEAETTLLELRAESAIARARLDWVVGRLRSLP